MNFYMPVKLRTGKGVLSENASLISSLGTRCIIVTSGSAAKKSGALVDVVSVLNKCGIIYTLYDQIQPNPSVSSCVEAGKLGKAFGAEFVIGIGGGSPLDASKVIAACISNPDYDAQSLYKLDWPNKPVPVVLIGTTSGTGSEVTPISVITNLNGNKVGMNSEQLYATLAFGDPRYTESMPLTVTATTGVDALCHCIESYLNKSANEISRAIAVQGISLLVPLLKKVAKGILPDSNEREILYNASILGGMAICITGTVAPHAIGYLLSESYNVPHGFACASFLPALLHHTESVDPALADKFYNHTHYSKQDYIDLIIDLLPEYDFHMSESEIIEKSARWTLSNGNIKRTPGICDQIVVQTFLKSVFI